MFVSHFVCHADNSPGTADINTSTASHHNPLSTNFKFITNSSCSVQFAPCNGLKTKKQSNILKHEVAILLATIPIAIDCIVTFDMLKKIV